ncbi:TRAP transporter small permease [Paracoccus saliphilus]|uniref:TRAP transporter small permease protein n=1 Tax=Paracoccus saliphilus TaxID=405559 RepID=A0AA45W2P4_9RHOB|nr:TRAP transporter small permease [Paracoccus saliphilus]WCR01415.1 TRAP transporter small permease [Paracoccus saliphilus]SIS69779.1 C4-dicarboxylate transporter, DctQ subunit [Paracoccus saliphilus]
MLSTALALIRAIDLTVSYISTIALVLITVLGVIMRYSLGAPLTWLEEVQMILIVWLVMFGGSVAFREFAHVAIDAICEMLPPTARRILDNVVALVVLAVLGLVVWTGFAFIQFQFGANRTTDVLHIPYGIAYLAVPIGASLMMLSFVCSDLLPRLARLPSDD